MQRLLTSLVALAFTAQMLAGSNCACGLNGDDAAMAPDHSCCVGVAQRAAAEDNGYDVGARGQPSGGCHCHGTVAILGDELASHEPIRAQFVGLPAPGPGAMVAVAAPSVRVRNPPPQWPPPRARDRLARLQIWLC